MLLDDWLHVILERIAHDHVKVRPHSSQRLVDKPSLLIVFKLRTVATIQTSDFVLADVSVSVAVLAGIPLRSLQKIFIFIIKKNIFWVKVSKNKIV